MKIDRLQTGIYSVNCYVLHTEEGHAVIVDPGGDSDEIIDFVAKEDLNVVAILLTHGHGDHIGGVPELKEALGVPVMVHAGDDDMVKDSSINMSSAMAMGDVAFEPDKLMNHGDLIEVGSETLEVIHTPGHTKGGVCLLGEGILITGDTLFQGSIGRTDLYGGDLEMLMDSIIIKLMGLPDETLVYPGHGGHSTIGTEKKRNPFIQNRMK